MSKNHFLQELLIKSEESLFKEMIFFTVDLSYCHMSDAMSLCPQVNREIVSGLKYVQQTFRKGMKSE